MRLAWLPLAALAAACATPAILDPHVAPGACNPNMEHACADGSCCLLNWACSGPQVDEPLTCGPDPGYCCDDAPPLGMGAATRSTPARRP